MLPGDTRCPRIVYAGAYLGCVQVRTQKPFGNWNPSSLEDTFIATAVCAHLCTLLCRVETLRVLKFDDFHVSGYVIFILFSFLMNDVYYVYYVYIICYR